jgi:hypothetical protein
MTSSMLGQTFYPKTEKDDSDYVEEINIFVSDGGIIETIDAKQNERLVKDESSVLEVPVVTIRVPIDAEDSETCTIELKNVPKSLLEVSIPTTKPTPQPKRAVQSYSPSPKSVQQAIKPVQNLQQIRPKAQPKSILKTPPVWKRETPKAPGAISNYMYPHELIRLCRSRLIIDCPTNIPVAEFKAQLADTSDIVTTLDVAPSTKKKIKELNTNSVSKLFAYPGKTQPSPRLRRLYQRHLTSKFVDHELTDDLELPPLDTSLDPKLAAKHAARAAQAPPVKKLRLEDSVLETVETVPTGQQNMVRLLLKQSDGTEPQEIIVLHDGAGALTPETLQSIEMVLASAQGDELSEAKGEQGGQVIICNTEENEFILVQNSELAVESQDPAG